MDIETLFRDCAEITKSKGFKVSEFATQMLLIASECAEAMECLGISQGAKPESVEFEWIKKEFMSLMRRFENYRSTATDHVDNSYVHNLEGYIEEVADIQIRVCSHIGGNFLTDQFTKGLKAKMEKNRKRPHKHGKGF
jgi:hypothetical protein